jgi:hypothetical protein
MGEGLKRARAAALATRTPPKKKITQAKAARFIAAMVALQECEDCPDGLRVALDDARAEIDPFYGDEDGR